MAGDWTMDTRIGCNGKKSSHALRDVHLRAHHRPSSNTEAEFGHDHSSRAAEQPWLAIPDSKRSDLGTGNTHTAIETSPVAL